MSSLAPRSGDLSACRLAFARFALTRARNDILLLSRSTPAGSASFRSARISSRRSIVLRTPMSSKCRSRKRRAARRPARCSISKKSKSLSSRLAARQPLADEPSTMRCTLMRRYSPGPGAARQPALIDQPA